MSWVTRVLSRDASGPSLPPAETAARPGTCGRSGCSERAVWRCDYVDRLGRTCHTWCARHVVFDGRRHWCQRHANVVRRVLARAETIYDPGVLPDIDDRMPHLVWLIVEEMDGLLRTALTGSPVAGAFDLITDPAVRSVVLADQRLIADPTGAIIHESRRRRSWQRGWGVVAPTGYLRRISVRSISAEPPVIDLLVDSRVAWEGVPEWITRRSGEAERARFNSSLTSVVVDEFAGRAQAWKHNAPNSLAQLR